MRDRLMEGDRRIVGAAGAVADAVVGEPELVGALIDLLDDPDTAVVAHASHAAMQISQIHPALFDAHIARLIELLRGLKQWELGEQLPKIVVRCAMTDSQVGQVRDALLANLNSEFNIVAACSLQGRVDLAVDGRIDRKEGEKAVGLALKSARKALAARARRLQKQLAATPSR